MGNPQERPMTWWEKQLFGVPFRNIGHLIPGLILAIAVMGMAQILAQWAGHFFFYLQDIDPAGRASPISGIVVAILGGMAIVNTIGVSPRFKPGLTFALKKILRVGIILVGFKLSFMSVMKFGVWVVPVVVATISAALLVTAFLAKRMGISHRLGLLTAAATSICGITATVSTAPVIEADEREVAFTVANVAMFGSVAMLAFPFLAHYLFADAPGSAGLLLGTAIHDTSQVMGAAMSYRDVFSDEVAFQVATVTKLTRNVFLVLVVPFIGLLHRKASGGSGTSLKLTSLLPLFVLGFIAAALLRSWGDAGLASPSQMAFGLWSGEDWTALTTLLGKTTASYALGTALAAVGLTTHFSVFKELGLKPFYLGGAAALTVATVGGVLAYFVGPFIVG